MSQLIILKQTLGWAEILSIHHLFSEIRKFYLVKGFGEEISELMVSGAVLKLDFLFHYQLLEKS